MQHLLLALSIIGLTIIATHERNRQNVEVTKVIETPKAIDVAPLPEQEGDHEFRTRHVMFDMYGI